MTAVTAAWSAERQLAPKAGNVTDSRVIAEAHDGRNWLVLGGTHRAHGMPGFAAGAGFPLIHAKNDAYRIFSKMLTSGHPPDDRFSSNDRDAVSPR